MKQSLMQVFSNDVELDNVYGLLEGTIRSNIPFVSF